MKFYNVFIGLALSATMALVSAPKVFAEENLFGYVYGADTLPEGERELYSWTTLRSAKGDGTYRAWDQQLEYEYGVTDRFQLAGYLTGRAHNIKDASSIEEGEEGLEDLKRKLAFNGLKLSAKYNVLSSYKDPLGLSFYIEPGFNKISKVSGEKETETGVEFKGIAQKNFLDSRLITAYNLTMEIEREESEDSSDVEGELSLEHTAGVSMRIFPNWYLGVEYRHDSKYPELGNREDWGSFLGPNIHLSGKECGVTFSWLPQISGNPKSKASSFQNLEEFERNEFRLKIGCEF